MNQTIALINEISSELQRLESDRPQPESYCWARARIGDEQPDLYFGGDAEAKAKRHVLLFGGEAFPLYRERLP
jgi:hypothetical protein